MTQPPVDVRRQLIMDTIRAFEREEQFGVDEGKVLEYFLTILADPGTFYADFQAGKFTSSDVRTPLFRALVAAEASARTRGLDSVDWEAASAGAREVIEVQMGCPWPFIIC